MRTRTVMAAAGRTVARPARAVPDNVRITTVVTDRPGKPVTGLTLKDFELREDGVVQKLVSVEPRRAEPRRIAILLDEFHMHPADTARVRDAVTRFVDEQLRADDTAVVLKPLDPLPAIRVTADRAACARPSPRSRGARGSSSRATRSRRKRSAARRRSSRRGVRRSCSRRCAPSRASSGRPPDDPPSCSSAKASRSRRAG